MSDVVIRTDRLGKQYHVGTRARYQTLRERIQGALGAAWRRQPTADQEDRAGERFWALKDVSFEIRRGEVVGIVGGNGAGKSTLLRILSRITEPTEGEADICGRVGSLLEVGTGFHSELTGRENTFLNGAILGMRNAEVARKFDAIVAFAEVERFIDTPVKHYSSGMYMRLAFAVAAHLETEVLFVDEVLAVGDVQFQRKCMGKMGEASSQGRTVLFVSHNMPAIANLCNRALCLDRGVVVHAGDVAQGIRTYYSLMQRPGDGPGDEERRLGTGEVRFAHVEPERDHFLPEEEKGIRFTLRRKTCRGLRIYLSVLVSDAAGMVVAHCDSRFVGVETEVPDELCGRFVLRLPWLKPGDYTVDFFACAVGGGILDRWERACTLCVLPILPYPHTATPEAMSAPVLADFGWQVD